MQYEWTKMTAEVTLWLEYQRSRQTWESNDRAQKRLVDKKQEPYINMDVADFCPTWAPSAKQTEDAVIPSVCVSITTLGG